MTPDPAPAPKTTEPQSSKPTPASVPPAHAPAAPHPAPKPVAPSVPKKPEPDTTAGIAILHRMYMDSDSQHVVAKVVTIDPVTFRATLELHGSQYHDVPWNEKIAPVWWENAQAGQVMYQVLKA